MSIVSTTQKTLQAGLRHRPTAKDEGGPATARAHGWSTDGSGAGTGPLGNNANLFELAPVRGAFEAVDQDTGEVVKLERKPNGTLVPAKPSRLEQVALAWRRKAALDKLLLVLPKRDDGQPHRCFKCHRYALPGSKVAAMYSEQYQKAFIAGTQTCANSWICPLCSRKISKRKAEEVQHGAELAKANFNLRPLLLTLDFRHSKRDQLADLLNKLTGKGSAYHLMSQLQGWKDLKKDLGYFGDISALEITHGQHGFHPHKHFLWFVEDHHTPVAEIQRRLALLWRKSCAKVGRDATLAAGANVQEGNDAAGYIAKMAAEIAAGSTKDGRLKGRSYLQLLDGAASGDKVDVALWKEWVLATKGRNALRWSQDLRQKLGMGRELTDEEIAAETEDHSAVVFSLISNEGWDLLYSRQLVSYLCFLIETDAGRAHEFINSIEEEAKK